MITGDFQHNTPGGLVLVARVFVVEYIFTLFRLRAVFPTVSGGVGKDGRALQS